MSVRDQNDVSVYGEALLTNGLVVRHGINGYGLLTRGFLWQLYDIFIDVDRAQGLSTSWSNSESSLTTTWSNTETSLTTNWTDILTPS
jgi:hypothetical protein